jgi:hypothetical protein
VQPSDQEPIEKYKAEVNAAATESHPYDRLMIHFRKMKKYDEELQVIKKGIATFRTLMTKSSADILNRFGSARIKSLSNKINKQMGLVDKKGNETFLPEPLARWVKRQSVVEEKLKKKKS